jgi:hypothetical protein
VNACGVCVLEHANRSFYYSKTGKSPVRDLPGEGSMGFFFYVTDYKNSGMNLDSLNLKFMLHDVPHVTGQDSEYYVILIWPGILVTLLGPCHVLVYDAMMCHMLYMNYVLFMMLPDDHFKPACRTL